jgi:uncharacterized protein (DUF362 family)
MITRRQFIGGMVAGPLVIKLGGCDQATPPPGPIGSDAVLLGLYQVGDSDGAVKRALAHIDLSWLKKGDSVLVKLASNSGNPHPAVTSPAAVRALCTVLKQRGAGRVIVADQSGAEWVRLAPGEMRFSSTGALTAQNGIAAAITAAGAEAHYFDDDGYAAGYFEAMPPSGSHWTQPLMIPQIVQSVDHIVYLPRMAAHVLCGCTIGHKLAMGFLRDDSRYHVHHEAANIYEKYAEISYVPEIRSRFRLALTLTEAMLLDNGPDTGTIAPADPLIVIASQNLAHHDAVATGLLIHFDATVASTVTDVYDPAKASDRNQLFVELGVATSTRIQWGPDNPTAYEPYTAHLFDQGIEADRALGRAFAIRGGLPSTIPVVGDGQKLAAEPRATLDRWGGGRFRFA